MKKVETPAANPKDPVLGKKPAPKATNPDYDKKSKVYLENKKLGKEEELEKAKIDTKAKETMRAVGIPEEKITGALREGRVHRKPYQEGVHTEPGAFEQNKLQAQKEHGSVSRQAAKIIPNLPKSEEGVNEQENQQSHELISVPHILFSMDNPAHGEHNPHNHNAILHVLKNMGADVYEIQGNYGHVPEKSILVRNPTEDISNTVSHLARKSGQESVLHSDGQNHELHFLNGPMVGSHVKGSGTTYHTTAPETNFSVLPDGAIFSHNLNFDQEHPNE